MPHYVCLVTFTHQGLRQLGATTHRAKAFQEHAKKMGVTVHETYWTLGSYDLVHIIEAPDDETAAALAFSLGSLGNVRSHTMRAFKYEEMKNIVGKVTTPFDLLND